MIEELRTRGVVRMPQLVAGHEIAEIVGHLRTCRVRNHHHWPCGDDEAALDAALGHLQWPVAGHHDGDVVAAPHFLEFLEKQRQIAEQWFSRGTSYTTTQAFWTAPSQTHYRDTHDWHRDRGGGREIAFFTYGTDVLDPTDGAHHYEIGSHLDEDRGENYNGYEPTREVAVLLGAAGTTYVTDPFGVHLGQRPERGPRLILVVRWT